METKTCNKCKEQKPKTDKFFRLRNGSFESPCRGCIAEYTRQWKQKNPEKVREQKKRYRGKHPEKFVEAVKRWKQKNPEKVKEQKKRYNEKYPEKDAARKKRWKQENPEKVNKYIKENRDKINEWSNQWKRANRDKVNEWRRRYMDVNPHAKIVQNLRNRLYAILKGTKKSAPTMELIGCTLDELKQHLESQFTDGMTWNNYGEWHVDHIVPCAAFDLTEPEQQRICFNYTNLQPLWAEDNVMKNDKLPHEWSDNNAYA
jgi:hypothetical protein